MTSYCLEDKFRQKILKLAIKRAGSKYSLAMTLGYTSVGAGKTINDWYDGRQGIPLNRLETLSKLINIPLDEVLKHQSDSVND